MKVKRNIENGLGMRTWEGWVGRKPPFLFPKQLDDIRLWIQG